MSCYEKNVSSFTRCSRRSFLCVDGELGDNRHRVMLLSTLPALKALFICPFKFKIFDVLF